MESKNDMVSRRKKYQYVTGCITCEYYYTHHRFISERRNGVTLKSGKIYCLFPKKPVKMDARKRHIDIPSDCPRHNVPIRFALYTLKKRAPIADATTGNVGRYWRVHTGNIDMVTRSHLFGGGSYSTPDTRDGFLWNNGEQVHRLQQDDVVVREDGFTIKAWQWNREYFVSAPDFDEAGIKKMPKRKGD